MKNIFLATLILTVSCSSVSERVITRMDDLSEKPKWASISKVMFADKGKVFSVGYSEGLADNRVSALSRIADNNARLEISRNILNETGFIFQNIEEGINEGGQFSRFYGNELSKSITHGVRQERRYWEKVKTFDESGDVIFKVRVYSLISIEEKDLRKAIKMSLTKKKEISPKMREAIDNHITSQIKSLKEQ